MISATSMVTLWIAWNTVSAYKAYRQKKSALHDNTCTLQKIPTNNTTLLTPSSIPVSTSLPSLLSKCSTTTATALLSSSSPLMHVMSPNSGGIVSSVSTSTLVGALDPRLQYIQKVLILLWWYGHFQTWYNITNRAVRGTCWLSNRTWLFLKPARKLLASMKDMYLEIIYNHFEWYPESYWIEKEARRQQLWAKLNEKKQNKSLIDGWILVGESRNCDNDNDEVQGIVSHNEIVYGTTTTNSAPVDNSLISQWTFISSPVPCVDVDTLLQETTTVVDIGDISINSNRKNNMICTNAAAILDANVRMLLHTRKSTSTSASSGLYIQPLQHQQLVHS